jgi:hypothetical protein
MLKPLLFILQIVLVSMVLGSSASGQRASGADIEGVWNFNTMTPLERPDGMIERATFTPAEAAEFERTFFERGAERFAPADRPLQIDFNETFVVVPRLDRLRTSLIVDPPDGKLPALSPAAAERAAATPKRSFDNPESLLLVERCLVMSGAVGSLASPPLIPVVAYDNFLQIVVARDQVLLFSEWVHDARVVRIGGTHLPASMGRWLGDSIGHWEGTTLVVDTTNFRGDTRNHGASEQLHIVEWFTSVDETTLRYRVTVEDPQTWVRPWTAEWLFHATADTVLEVACHEGNYDVENFLRGARSEELGASESPDK